MIHCKYFYKYLFCKEYFSTFSMNDLCILKDQMNILFGGQGHIDLLVMTQELICALWKQKKLIRNFKPMYDNEN